MTNDTTIKEGEPPPQPAPESRPSNPASMKNLLVFTVGGLALGGIALGIGYWAWGEDALTQGGTAFGLAFVPATLTLAWVLYSYRSTPEMQLLASLGSSGMRMAIALGGGFLLTNAQPETFSTPFWFWLVLFYLALLAFEITLVIRQQPKLESPQPQGKIR
jgi:hypothetical protein